MNDAAAAAPPPGKRYRTEIDGLRAIAVLAVILHHTGLGWLPGGFLGVDLFFVISGYLITGILLADLEQSRFSATRFYERRIRRILPALLVTMALCVPVAMLVMIPDDLQSFGQSLVATAAFANNLLLYLSGGYFTEPMALKPLMHSWSLGVEEQYYLAVPLLMLALWRVGGRRAVWIGIAVVTIVSFFAFLRLGRIDPRASYFLLFGRGWELGAGALALLAEPRLRALAGRTAPWLAAGGLLAALVSLVLIDEARFGTGWATLVPVGGICLLLLFADARDAAGRLLTLAPMRWIGLISYSAYLIHQPAFAFVRIVSLEPPSPILLGWLILPILLGAWACWRFVEQPFRDRNRIGTRTAMAVCGAASLSLLAIGATLHVTGGEIRRWPELRDQQGRREGIAYNMAAVRYRYITLPGPADGRVRVLVIGESFGRDFINMMLDSPTIDPRRLVINQSPANLCRHNWLAPALARQLPNADFVVITGRYQIEQVRCMPGMIAILQQHSSARIFVLGRKSFGWNNNAVMLLDPAVRYAWHARPSDEATRVNAELKRTLPADVYIDLVGTIADARGRVPVFTPDRRFISVDQEHLTRPGAVWLGGMLLDRTPLRALRDAAAVRR